MTMENGTEIKPVNTVRSNRLWMASDLMLVMAHVGLLLGHIH